MEWIFPQLCLHCSEPTQKLVCEGCVPYFEFLTERRRFTACFEEIESVRSFREQLGDEWIQKAAISFLMVRFEQLGWEEPDLVTSIPRRHLFSSNLSAILARGFAKKMGLPYKQLAKRKFGDLPREENPTFLLRSQTEAKKILIIDDYIQTGKTMRNLGRLLRVSFGAHVNGLALTQRQSPDFSTLP